MRRVSARAELRNGLREKGRFHEESLMCRRECRAITIANEELHDLGGEDRDNPMDDAMNIGASDLGGAGAEAANANSDEEATPQTLQSQSIQVASSIVASDLPALANSSEQPRPLR